MKPKLLALFTLLPCLTLAQSTPDSNPTAPPPHEGGMADMGQRHGPPTADEMLQHLTKALDLTSSQQEEIKPMLTSEQAKMKALHENTSLTEDQKHEQMKTIRDATHKQITQVLTPDQAKKFQEFHPQFHSHHGTPPA